MSTKTVGELTEAKVMTALLAVGYAVLVPWGDNQRYDLVIDDGGKFLRVQCKTGHIDKGAVQFKAVSITGWPIDTRVEKSYVNDVEFFGIYVPQIDKVALIPISECGTSNKPRFRIEPTKNGQSVGVKWFDDYILGE